MESACSLAVNAIVLGVGQQATDGGDERFRIARLDKHGIEAGRTRQIELLGVGVASGGNQRDRAGVGAGLQVTRHFVPGLPGQLQVHDDGVRPVVHRAGECLMAISGRQHVEAGGAQIQLPYVEGVRVIVNNQDGPRCPHG